MSTIFDAREAEVASGERSVIEADIAEVSSNGTVEANLTARDTVKVIAEVTKASMELLEDDGLSLDLADLLKDDPLGHLLEDEQALLDDLDSLGVADDVLLFCDNLAEVDGAVEVVYTIEVVEVIEGRETTPVVKGEVADRAEASWGGDWLRDGTSDQGRGNEESGGKLGEHFECLVKEGVDGLKRKVEVRK